MLAFGSAATFMFWAKWLGKLSGIAGQPENVELTVHASEWISQILMATIAIVACIALPLVSSALVEPYIAGVYGEFGRSIMLDDLWITSILATFVIVVFFAGLGGSKAKRGTVYLAGVGIDPDARSYRNSLSGESIATSRNMYMESIFSEKRVRPVGEAICAIIIVMGIVASGIVPPVL